MDFPVTQMTLAAERTWVKVLIQLMHMQQDVRTQGRHQVGIGASHHTIRPRSTLNHK